MPSVPVVAVRITPVSRLRSSTIANGTTAPDCSMTVPSMLELNWPKATPGIDRATARIVGLKQLLHPLRKLGYLILSSAKPELLPEFGFEVAADGPGCLASHDEALFLRLIV